MKAPAFDYVRVGSLGEALDLLALHGDEARVLSGGQSLIPALNMRLASPAWIIDIGAIEELKGIAVANGVLRIGGLTRHVDVLKSTDVVTHAPLLTQAVANVAHPAIRNRGTIGGNLAHADPASELPACMMALDAAIIVQGKAGERRIAAEDFFVGIYETLLAPGELLTAVEIPVASPTAAHFFHEYSRRAGDYAIVGLAAAGMIENKAFDALRLGFFAIGDRPQLVAASSHLVRKPVTAVALADAQAALEDELEPHEDQQATANMRRYLARQLLERCVVDLLGRPDLATRGSA